MVYVIVVLTAVLGDAGTNTDASPSDTGGAPGPDAISGSDAPLGTGGSGGTGGVNMSGGTTSTGGVTFTGGVTRVGGSTSTGGLLDAGGGTSGFDAASGSDARAAAGTGGTGGVTIAGGTTRGGGATSTSGMTTAGGTTSSGGSSATGGATSTGGSTPTGGTTSTGGGTGGTGKMVATAVAAGYGHSCALVNDGTIWCWGRNIEGEIGNGDPEVDGTTLVRSVPVQVHGVTQAVSVTTGGYHTCALIAGGTVQCWGKNDWGQLGNGNRGGFSTTPTNVSGIPAGLTVVAVVGGTSHTCALLSDKTVNCWGDNRSRQLGMGDNAPTSSARPVPVVTNSSTQAPLSGVTSLAATHDHACAVQSGGASSGGPVYCWGYNYDGELGTGTFDNTTTVAIKVGTITAVAVGAGGDQSCAVGPPTTGAPYNVQCWGTDSEGEIGGGSRDGGIYAYTPVHALVSGNATIIALGWSHSCAVLVGGAIQCWGYNYYGQLGNGSSGDTASSEVPVTVKSLSQAVGLSGGDFHTCAVVSAGAVYCWGGNGAWQLGNSGSDSAVPVLVTLGP